MEFNQMNLLKMILVNKNYKGLEKYLQENNNFNKEISGKKLKEPELTLFWEFL
jgi:hypothetical protein